jgi:endogenous inhibitor of DNA gyrase (YacG/DUF329 family)
MNEISQNEQSSPCCPQCNKPMTTEQKNLDSNPFFPFCSRSCKMVDLDKWFTAEYAISQSVDELNEDQINEILNDEVENVQTGNDIRSTG